MNTRLDRQTRIEGWRQDRLDSATLVIAGDNLAADFIALAAAALGVRRIRLIRPDYAAPAISLTAVARALQPGLELLHLETPLVGKGQSYLLEGASIIVDVSTFGIARKLCVQFMHEHSVPGLLVKLGETDVAVYRYARGREDARLGEFFDVEPLPVQREVDPVLAMVAAGVVLEELKNILMERESIEGIVKYSTGRLPGWRSTLPAAKVLVVGAGALGNIVALLLELLGASAVDILDFDTVDETNLNRQVLLHGAVGRPKAAVLADRLSIPARGLVDRFDAETSLEEYDVVLDCVDKFEVRALISARCEAAAKPLVSGGTNYAAGQVVAFVPGKTDPPAKRLNFTGAAPVRARAASCIAAPDPSVIMSNMLIGAMMINELRRIVSPELYAHAPFDGIAVYKADAPERISVLGASS